MRMVSNREPSILELRRRCSRRMGLVWVRRRIQLRARLDGLTGERHRSRGQSVSRHDHFTVSYYAKSCGCELLALMCATWRC
jgi:hypothetical protein